MRRWALDLQDLVLFAVGEGVYALDLGVEEIRDRVFALAEDLRERLRAVPGVRVHDLGRERCGIVTFTVDGIEAPAVRASLGRRRINVSTSSRQGALLDMEARGLPSLVRASVHCYNTEDEVERFVQEVSMLRGP